MNYFIFTAFKMLLTDVQKQLLANTGERKIHSPDLFLSNPSINICTNTVLNHAEHYLIRYSNKSSNWWEKFIPNSVVIGELRKHLYMHILMIYETKWFHFLVVKSRNSLTTALKLNLFNIKRLFIQTIVHLCSLSIFTVYIL